jgi:hypothetical protein
MNHTRLTRAQSAAITRQNRENLFLSRKTRAEVLLKRSLRKQFTELQFPSPDELVEAYLTLMETK